jgi:arsenite methyltransferase
MRTESQIKDAVRQRYGEVAAGKRSCCTDLTHLRTDAGGYRPEELALLPEGAALGLGCGVPTRLVPLEPGVTVLDLGSGAGVDAFLAAQQVGPTGRVIGVDMTDGMLEKARANAAAGGYTNVEFRRGEIENLPVEGGSIDVILSNCVINLAPDKRRVFREAHRVLRPGGRMQISDIVTRGEMPEAVRRDLEQWAGCVAGAIDRQVYLEMIREAGFAAVEVADEFAYDSGSPGAFAALSLSVVATK